MDSQLLEVWQAAKANPFAPVIGKNSQFLVGFSLVLLAIALLGAFSLNRTVASIGIYGLPASLAAAFGVVYMFCAVGVYV